MPSYTIAQLPSNGCTITDNGSGSFTLNSPRSGASSSAIVYFQNTTGSSLSLTLNWNNTGSAEGTNFDRIFWYNNSIQPTVSVAGATTGQYKLNSNLITGGNSTSKLNNIIISSIGWNNFVGLNYTQNSFQSQSGTQSITVLPNNWVAVMIAADSTVSARFTITGFTDAGVCVGANSEILMFDYSIKMIKDIQRGDQVIQDIKSNSIATVSNIVITSCDKLVLVPKNLLGNQKELIITHGHPIWINNDTNRILARDIIGIETYNDIEPVYNLQFDFEGTFYANNIKIDSLTPYQTIFPLPKNLFINPDNYIPDYIVLHEDEPRRNKPKMIDFYDPNIM